MLTTLLNITIDFVLKYIAKIILFILGYKIDKKLYDITNEKKGYVWIYPHTSKIEGILLILFNLVIQDRKILFGIKSSIYDNMFLQPFLKKVGAIRIPMHNETRIKSTVDTISEILNKKENVNNIFCISPEGMMNPNEWRTGFFYIAKNTNRQIIIGGVDYHNHLLTCLDVKYDVSNISKYENFKEFIQDDFSKSKLYPLYPECSYPRIIMDNNYYTTSIDYVHFTNCIASIICLTNVYDVPIFNILIPVLIFISYMYHYYRENNFFYAKLDSIYSKMFVLYTLYNFFFKIIYDIYALFLLFLTWITFHCPGKRSEQTFRKKEYIIYHSIFHIIISITFVYLIKL